MASFHTPTFVLSLPPELLFGIFSLAGRDCLPIICLTNSHFRDLVRPLLFSNLSLRNLRQDRDTHDLLHPPFLDVIRRCTTQITLGSAALAYPHIVFLSPLLTIIGPNLDYFALRPGTFFKWDNIDSGFRNVLHSYVFPHIRDLRIVGMKGLPLLAILRQCSGSLQELTIDSDSLGHQSCNKIPSVVSLRKITVGIALGSQFGHSLMSVQELKQLLSIWAARLESITFNALGDSQIVITLLNPGETQAFRSVTIVAASSVLPREAPIPFDKIPNFRKLVVHFATNYPGLSLNLESVAQFDWLAKQLSYASDNSIHLDTVECRIDAPSWRPSLRSLNTDHESLKKLDMLATQNVRLNLQFILNSSGDESFDNSYIKMLKNGLPSWKNSGRLLIGGEVNSP
ncbi:hypothetical protein DL96DRAFT_1716626 [Flagelloscypha sp. PMI_526]|nr:hypothetical protein DL96DRAFT_1716626 [Flagelloscypha sp. PMI_526]